MRQITRDSVKAFLARKPFNKQNMSVTVTDLDDAFMYLHGNLIAQHYANGAINITMAGWPTDTTRERLNGILTSIDVELRVCQRNHKQVFIIYDYQDTKWTNKYVYLPIDENKFYQVA